MQDPRVQRTHQLLHQSLQKLLEKKDFSKISVQEIATQATLNRATFYDHYPDKAALLECMVGMRFEQLLADRGIAYSANCGEALFAIALSVCDYLAGLQATKIDPHLEKAVITVLRKLLLKGIETHKTSPTMVAATAAWALYGAAEEWWTTTPRSTSKEAASLIAKLIAPILTIEPPAPTWAS